MQNLYINFRNKLKLKNLKILCIMSMILLEWNYIWRLRLQFSYWNEYKFRYGFNETVNPMCCCGTEVETNEHFMRCHCFSSKRSSHFDNLSSLDLSFSKLNNKEKIAYLLHESTCNPNILNKVVINLVIKFLKLAGCFDKPLWPMEGLFFIFIVF